MVTATVVYCGAVEVVCGVIVHVRVKDELVPVIVSLPDVIPV